MRTSYLTLAILSLSSLGSSAPNKRNTTASQGAVGVACADDVNALAAGIQENINDQHGEANSALQIQALITAGHIDQNKFSTAKGQLLSFVLAGIAVRQQNQAIAPPNNPAVAGLEIVANAQLTELGLSSQLTGVSGDLAILKQLATDFAGGIKQNQQNLLDATGGCIPADAQAAAGILTAKAAGLVAGGSATHS